MANLQIPYSMKPTYKSATYQEISSDYIYIELDCNVREDCRKKNATKIYYCFHDKIVRWWRPNGSLRRGRAEKLCRAFDKCELSNFECLLAARGDFPISFDDPTQH